MVSFATRLSSLSMDATTSSTSCRVTGPMTALLGIGVGLKKRKDETGTSPVSTTAKMEMIPATMAVTAAQRNEGMILAVICTWMKTERIGYGWVSR